MAVFMCMQPFIFSRVDVAIRKQRLRRAIQDARRECEKNTKECAVAWDFVDELCKADRKISEREREREQEREHWEEMSDKEFDV
jgi:hypothetical protein